MIKKENFKTKFSPLNNSKLKKIKGGATDIPPLIPCDANIVVVVLPPIILPDPPVK